MPRPKDKSLQEVFLKADQALSEIKDSRLVMKLLAIRGYGNQKAKDIAALFNTETRTIYKWVSCSGCMGYKVFKTSQKDTGKQSWMTSTESRYRSGWILVKLLMVKKSIGPWRLSAITSTLSLAL
jgi:hypothetical protein